jgi:S-formylglutathione hydrolase
MSITKTKSYKTFAGETASYQHASRCCNCDMTFAIYLPPGCDKAPVPVLYWLSGLTCDSNNFMQKAGAQRLASELNIAIVAPDTSPRGEDVADDVNSAYDLGLGAGFYVNATQPNWSKHYQMYDYVTKELPEIIATNFPVTERIAISGHSMGGHGALVCALRNPRQYVSVSAFGPICNPVASPWGIKAFKEYLGNDVSCWNDYDASILMHSATEHLPMRIDIGDSDEFLDKQLKPQTLLDAAKASGYPIDFHMQPGYDHNYYFISSFIAEHIKFHARYLFSK